MITCAPYGEFWSKSPRLACREMKIYTVIARYRAETDSKLMPREMKELRVIFVLYRDFSYTTFFMLILN